MSPITTHVLDTAAGKPAAGVDVLLEKKDGAGWKSLAKSQTDEDGRIKDLLPEGALEAATYRLTFGTGKYYEVRGVRCFYPEVQVAFTILDPEEHYHVPLLLSPYGYSTYRGS